MEPPGTAPGSEPPITGAFIAIVRVAPDKKEYRTTPDRAQAAAETGAIKSLNPIAYGPDLFTIRTLCSDMR